MKFTIQSTLNRGFRVVKSRAVINKSQKLKIDRRYQKTWTVRTVAPDFAVNEMHHSIECEAKRWEEKVMKKCGERVAAETATSPS